MWGTLHYGRKNSALKFELKSAIRKTYTMLTSFPQFMGAHFLLDSVGGSQ